VGAKAERVTRRRAILLGAAAVCLGLATNAALTARDVGEWQGALRAGDIAAVAPAPGRTPSWNADTVAPFGLARRLLALDDDLAFRGAVTAFRRAHTRIPSFDSGLRGTALRVQAEAALAHEIRSDRNNARTTAAANLLGVLAVLDSGSPAEGSTPVERAIFEFEDAIHLDPENEQAKTNLELLYQLTSPPNTPRGSVRRSGRSHSGASATSPGHGY
jgi:hypothetical protein